MRHQGQLSLRSLCGQIIPHSAKKLQQKRQNPPRLQRYKQEKEIFIIFVHVGLPKN